METLGFELLWLDVSSHNPFLEIIIQRVEEGQISDNHLISFIVSENSKMPPILSNRNRLNERIAIYQGQQSKYKEGIDERQFRDACAHTDPKIKFASFQRIKNRLRIFRKIASR